MSNVPKEQIDRCLPLAAAAAWSVRLAEHDVATTPEFEAWLAESPENSSAWERVSGILQFIGEQQFSPELIAVRREALADLRDIGPSRWYSRAAGKFVAGLALALIIPLGIATAIYLSPKIYETNLGERRIVMLTDGSRLSLDSASRVDVSYTWRKRRLALEKGQARFDVARDPQRPFTVQVDNREVVALGTAFNIDREGTDVVVTLLHGKAAVLLNTSSSSAGSDTRHRVDLEPGQEFRATADKTPTIRKVNIANATAWETGHLVFDDLPLAQVVRVVNRYSATSVVIDDTHVGEMRISGVFRAGDIPGFIEIVTSYLPIHAVGENRIVRLVYQPK